MLGSQKFFVLALVLVTISVMMTNVAGSIFDDSDDSSSNEDEVRSVSRQHFVSQISDRNDGFANVWPCRFGRIMFRWVSVRFFCIDSPCFIPDVIVLVSRKARSNTSVFETDNDIMLRMRRQFGEEIFKLTE